MITLAPDGRPATGSEPLISRGSYSTDVISPQRQSTNILCEVIASVRHLSEEGDLPLFAWTLGLPQNMLVNMLAECGLPSWRAECLLTHEYQQIEKMVPETFDRLRICLLQHRTRLLDPIHADYLARAIAAASFGNRPLWQDLGLNDEKALLMLLATFFHPIYQKNKHLTKWKSFLFGELHAVSGDGSSVPEMLLKCVRNRQ